MMIKLFLIPGLIMLSCGSTKSNQTAAKTDSIMVVQSDKTQGDDAGFSGLPTCIKNKIDSFKLKEDHEKPQRVIEYLYKGKKVYYVVMPCCDFFSEVYDDKCNFLGSPDGGITGRGDGKLPDFFENVTGKKLVWGKPE